MTLLVIARSMEVLQGDFKCCVRGLVRLGFVDVSVSDCKAYGGFAERFQVLNEMFDLYEVSSSVLINEPFGHTFWESEAPTNLLKYDK